MQRNTYSSVRCVRSVWPSVWGWYALARRRRVPRRDQSCCQNCAVNRGSRSLTSDFGTPKRDTTASKNKSAVAVADMVPSPSVQGATTTYFVNFSTQVRNALQPFETGKSVTKSIVHVSNRDVGISNGSSNPPGSCVLSFYLEHTSHSRTYCVTSEPMLGQNTRWASRACVRSLPKWPAA